VKTGGEKDMEKRASEIRQGDVIDEDGQHGVVLTAVKRHMTITFYDPKRGTVKWTVGEDALINVKD
jgi:hypothetical protein